jgi:hypothetical protein
VDHGHAQPQQAGGYHFPPEPEPNFGYGQPHASQPHQPQQQWGQQPDPRGYDLGSYMPPGGAQPYHQPEPAAFHDPSPFRQPHAPYAQQHPQPHPGYGEQDHFDDDDLLEEEDEPRGGGRRWLLIAAALVGAIGVGGALAYTYKAIVAPGGGRVPWVKADPNVKVKPDARANKDAGEKKQLTRLADENKAPPQADAQDDSADGPKRVKTIAIPVGSNPPPAAAAPPPPPPAVAGIMLDMPPPRGQQAGGNQQGVKVAPAPPPPPPPASLQVEAEEVQPPPKRVVAPVASKPPPPPPPAAPPAPREKIAVASAAPTGAGYVAVLSSQKSRMDALKVFADMQQKYGDVLGNKTPDVQQADLSARGLGVMYRLVVGPPGSRDAASGVCSQLKSAGYVGCWVTEY